MQQWRPENAAMTFDEVSMERSKSFVKALQELKNLRPQLYSAAEYCERSYLHSEQKQMVLDNLKNYAVRALVNAVDHLGTVAYKLTDLLEQQMVDISTIDVKITCLNQRTLTCQAYGDKGGLDQLQMSIRTVRHHKHYILPNSATQTVQSSSHDNANLVQGKPHSHDAGKSVAQTLSWHLASEPNSAPNVAPSAASSTTGVKASKVNPQLFRVLVAEEPAASMPLSSRHRSSSVDAADMTSSMVPPETSRSVSLFRAIDSPGTSEISRARARSKSVLSTFFTKNKTFKQRKLSVS